MFDDTFQFSNIIRIELHHYSFKWCNHLISPSILSHDEQYSMKYTNYTNYLVTQSSRDLMSVLSMHFTWQPHSVSFLTVV